MIIESTAVITVEFKLFPFIYDKVAALPVQITISFYQNK